MTKEIRKTILIVLNVFIWLLSSCNMNNFEETRKEQGISAEKLVVYLSAPLHGFQSTDESGKENVVYYYPSKYIVGMRMVGGEIDCVGGNVFAQALQEYSNKTGLTLEVHYVEEYQGDQDIFAELYAENNLPDLAILNKHSKYDYYDLQQKGILMDFGPFMEEDIWDEQNYYQEILSGGVLAEEQVIFPLLFNLSGLFTTSSYLDKIGLDILEIENTYEDVLYLLERSCVTVGEAASVEAIFEASGLMSGGRYIPSILMGAAYTSYFNEEVTKCVVTEKVTAGILNVMRLYNNQEFSTDPEWESKTYIENLNNPELKSRKMCMLEKGMSSQVGVFLSGGRSGGINFHNSILTDAAYFNSIYKEKNEELVFCGIPTVEDQKSYAANISVFAIGFRETKYPEEVYNLIRYLLDYSYPTTYGFSVNKKITYTQLENIQKNTFCLNSDGVWSAVMSGVKSQEEIQNDIEIIDPLDSKIVNEIEEMLENIAGAGIPFGPLEYDMFFFAIQRMEDDHFSCKETGTWLCGKINKYLSLHGKREAFYDPQYLELIINSD